MSSTDQPGTAATVVTAASCKRSASLMDWGNLVAILLPIPLIIFWFGASMFVYAMNRHHPNERVGYFTQHAAYRFYGVVGFFTAVSIFFPGGGAGVWWIPYLVSWVLALLVLVPWTIWDLVRIAREPWEDLEVTVDKHSQVG